MMKIDDIVFVLNIEYYYIYSELICFSQCIIFYGPDLV